MTDELSARYADLLDETYDFVDRIVLNAYHSPHLTSPRGGPGLGRPAHERRRHPPDQEAGVLESVLLPHHGVLYHAGSNAALVGHSSGAIVALNTALLRLLPRLKHRHPRSRGFPDAASPVCPTWQQRA